MQQPSEQWKPVVGYESIYEVSDRGNVRSTARLTSHGRWLKEQARKPSGTPSGHLKMNLRRDGQQRKHWVHRLVLEAFIGPAPAGTQCCHNDGDPTNNSVDNLRWGTPHENSLDSVEHGSHAWASKTECPRGHALVAPNLKPSILARGARQCLACAREMSAARNQKRAFDPSRADARLAEILEAGTNAPLRKRSCPRGHELIPANLKPSELKHGRRACLACDRERATARRESRSFDASRADERFRNIVANAT